MKTRQKIFCAFSLKHSKKSHDLAKLEISVYNSLTARRIPSCLKVHFEQIVQTVLIDELFICRCIYEVRPISSTRIVDIQPWIRETIIKMTGDFYFLKTALAKKNEHHGFNACVQKIIGSNAQWIYTKNTKSWYYLSNYFVFISFCYIFLWEMEKLIFPNAGSGHLFVSPDVTEQSGVLVVNLKALIACCLSTNSNFLVQMKGRVGGRNTNIATVFDWMSYSI